MQKLNVTSLSKIVIKIIFNWENNIGVSLYRKEVVIAKDYENPIPITFTELPKINQASLIKIKVYIEENLICYVEQSLKDSEMLF